MLKSQILEKLHKKHNNLSSEDIENLFENFIKILDNNLKIGKNIELRGFGTISKKIKKRKLLEIQKPERMFKKNSFKLHYKIGKTLHKKINENLNNEA